MEIGNPVLQERRKSVRRDSQRHFIDINPDEKRNLGLTGVIHVLKSYDGFDGGINCCICGKLYKSKVCFTKHIWEHSVYWDQFKGEKNHDRVLSIQYFCFLHSSWASGNLPAALILFGQNQGNTDFQNDNFCSEVSKMLPELLVTAPNEKRKDVNGNVLEEGFSSPTKGNRSPNKRRSPGKSKSPSKRKRVSREETIPNAPDSSSSNETFSTSAAKFSARKFATNSTFGKW